MTTMRFHPLADLFPLIEGAEFDELVASIKAHGLREPITLFNGVILDGRNRYRACEKAKVAARFEQFAGDDPHSFVADKNIHRRHLNTAQRSMIAAEMANMKEGNPNLLHPTTGIPVVGISIEKAAKLMGVNKDTVSDAKLIIAHGTPDEIRAMKEGRGAVTTLAKQIRANVSTERRVTKSVAGRDSQKRNAKIWNDLREAVTLLSAMPRAVDVVRIARPYENRTNVIDARLFQSLQWLKDFSHEWSKRGQAADQDRSVSG